MNIRTILIIPVAALQVGDDASPLSPMVGTLPVGGRVVLDLMDYPDLAALGGETIGRYGYDGAVLVELQPLDLVALEPHLAPVPIYGDDGEQIGTEPAPLRLPVEIAGWPESATAVPQPLAPLRAAARTRINAAYTVATDVLAVGYPYRERESWHVQVAEALALLADDAAATPWIDAAAAERGLDRVDLAQRIRANDQAYRQVHGALSGVRQALEDAITAASTAADIEATQWPQGA